MVGSPIETRVPEGREPVRTVAQFLEIEPASFIGQSETGRPDIVLFPAFR